MAKSFKTFFKLIAKDYYNQSVNPPIVRASTIIFKTMNELRKTQAKGKKNPTGGHFDYGRQGTSTTYILQKMLKEMEECHHVFLTPTGFGSVFLAILGKAAIPPQTIFMDLNLLFFIIAINIIEC